MYKRTLLLYLYSLILILSIVPAPASASVNSDLSSFFSSLGYEGNITTGSSYRNQAAGYYSGGSVFLRNQVKNLQIMHVDVPSYKAGCGGIDLFAGGFSFIDSANLVSFFQKIMNNALGYMFNLALETEVPEIAHSMQYIQGMSERVNNSNINSCDMAEDLVGGLWPKRRASQQHICEDIGSQDNVFSDWAAARQGCGMGGKFSEEMQRAGSDARYQNETLVNKNLVWAAIQKNGFLRDDTELAELFMSLSGTIIYDINGNASYYASLASDRNLIKALLNGGMTKIYSCDEKERCLNLKESTITIDKENSLNSQVRHTINEIVLEVQNDSNIKDSEKGFLNTISLPVLKFITASLSLKGGADALDIAAYSDLIAKDLLEQYIKEALVIVDHSLTTGDYTLDIKQELTHQIKQALSEVEKIKSSSDKDLRSVTRLVNNMRILEREFIAKMSTDLKSNLNLGGGEV